VEANREGSTANSKDKRGLSLLSLDGFRPEHREAFVAFRPEVAERFHALVSWSSRRLLRVNVRGIERLPRGRALLVANHAFGWDVIIPIAEIWRRTHRRVWVLGEHAWWRFPFLRRLAAAIGTVDGTPENADRLLGNDELVLVMPGGLREAVKPRELIPAALGTSLRIRALRHS